MREHMTETGRRRVARAEMRRAGLEPGEQARSDQDALDHIAEVSRNARTTWFGLLGLMLFCAVALMGHQDRDFFVYGAATELPLIGVEVPPDLFFLGAPAFVLGLYTYLHVYLVKLWRALAAAPERPSGRFGGVGDLDEATYPWLLADAALRWRSPRFRRPFGWLSAFVSWLLGWALAPMLLAMFWIRSMPLHNEWITLYLGALLLASLSVGWRSRGFAWRILTGRGVEPSRRATIAGWAGVSAMAAVIGLASWMTTEAGLIAGDGETEVPFGCVYWSSVACLQADFARNGDAAFLYPANLERAVFGQAPDGYLPRDQALAEFRDAFIARQRREHGPRWKDALTDEDGGWDGALKRAVEARRATQLDRIALRDLSGADLRRANLRGAFLPNARLIEVRMAGANLRGARMEGANLEGAQMEGADLSRARMEGANLVNARMEGANLSEARMEGANLIDARMEGAHLVGAWMEGANLIGARMEGARLSWARMEGATLIEARMEGANLRWARMEGASLVGADLGGVRSSAGAASEHQADAAPAEDRPARGLTQATIDRTFGDAATARTLPDGLVAPEHWAKTELGVLEANPAWRAWRIEQGGDPAPSTEDDE